MSPHLTTREWEVARLVAERWSNQEIADRLHVSVNTVQSYIRVIAAKLPDDGRRQRQRIQAYLAAA